MAYVKPGGPSFAVSAPTTACQLWELTAYTVQFSSSLFRVAGVKFDTITNPTLVFRDTATITNIGSQAFRLESYSKIVVKGPVSAMKVFGLNGQPLELSLPVDLLPSAAFSVAVECNSRGYVGEMEQEILIATNDPEVVIPILLKAVSIDTVTSVDDESINTGLMLHVTPQPASTLAIVEITSVEPGIATMELVDLAGWVVFVHSEYIATSPQTVSLPLSNAIATGTYILRAKLGQHQASARIMISR